MGRFVRPVVVGALAVAMAGCATARLGTPAQRPVHAPGSAGLYVFLEDDPRGTRGAALELVQAFAKREDGGLVPLQPAAAPSAGMPERVWMSGSVPAGSYVGLEITLAPDRATALAFPFLVSADSGTVLTARVEAQATPGEANDATAVIVLGKPGRIASGLLGLASVGGWDAVELFDKRSGRVAGVLPVGRGPAGIAIDTPHLRAYVAAAGDDTVAVIDLLEERIRERITLRGGDAPNDVAVTPDGRTLVVANSGSDTLSFVDTVAAVETDRLPVGARPVSVVMTSDGRRAYVVAESGSAITVVDVLARAVIGTIATDTGPVQARLGGRTEEILYVAHRASPYLIVVDAAALTVLRRVYVGNGARALAVEARTGRVLLARAGLHKVEVFDPGSFLPVDEIALGADAVYLAPETEGNALGVILGGTREAAIVGNVGRRILVRAALGPDPSALRFVDAR